MSDDNPNNVSEVERIKWLISRIDLYHKTSLDTLDGSQAIFQNAGKDISKNLSTVRRGVFSVLAAIITVTFGINSFQPLDEGLFYMILAIISGVGIANYLIFAWLYGFVDYGFTLVFTSTHESRNRIAESQTYVTTQFADLGHLDLKIIKNYGIFTVLLHIAIVVDMANKIKQDKSYKILWLKKILVKEFDMAIETTKPVPELYEKFDNTQQFPETGYNLIETVLKEFKKEKRKNKN